MAFASAARVAAAARCIQYERHRPERTALYEIVRDNLETLYGAIEDGALDVRVPKHAKKELEAYLDCGLLCRGFAHLVCEACGERRIVAWSCKGRGFCPSCLGRRMCATAANLIEHVLPKHVALRQWVLTFPFGWRRRLAQDGALLGRLARLFVETVEAFYTGRADERVDVGAKASASVAKTGAVTVVQRTSSDMRLNPHLHVVFLDGAYGERDGELDFEPQGHLRTRDVGEVLAHAVTRMLRHLHRRGALEPLALEADGADAQQRLVASAVSGREPPAGPQWLRGLPPVRREPLSYDKPLCASLDGFSLHAATRAAAFDVAGKEALLRYVLRPPLAQQRVEHRADGLVRIVLKRADADGTMAVDMDPLSLLCRLATSVPPPRHHTVKYAGVLASASPWRTRIAPRPDCEGGDHCSACAVPAVVELPTAHAKKKQGSAGRDNTYRAWADLLRRTFSIDVLACPGCKGRMKLVAIVTDHASIVRFLAALGEPTSVSERSPARGPPYWRSTVLRRKALGHVTSA
jgi:Putative transposase/Transposase zinc-binding domain